MECWKARVIEEEGVGVDLKYKQDSKLFRRYTCNAVDTRLQLTDDTALLATTRAGAEEALHQYIKVADDLGMSVSTSKTKLMVTGREVTAYDRAPIPMGSDLIEMCHEVSIPWVSDISIWKITA